MAEHGGLLKQYKTQFKNFKELTQQLKFKSEEAEKAKTDQDYYQFLFDELEQANLRENEQAELETELNSLTHAEEIKRNLISASYLIDLSEDAAILKLNEALVQIQSLERYNPTLSGFTERLKSAIIEIKDVSAELENLEQSTSFNQAKADEINDRLTLLYTLQKKHRVQSNQELIDLQNSFSDKLNQISSSDEELIRLEKEINLLKNTIKKVAQQLSANRKKVLPSIEQYIIKMLAEVGMPNAQIKIEQTVTDADHLDKNGIDRVKFLFNANKGHQLSELNKVASGGELSRLMLSIKSLIAKKTALPTIIFDEIDTGVSGEVANRVGNIMKELAKNMQVITITHLPQMASKGDAHYFVYKEVKDNFTYTQIKRLMPNERVLEIAKMLSGENPKDAAIENAKELLDN
jgi:DNA repair protein RecN (Recombination protein N)